MAICLFRAIGALARDLVVANALGSLSLLAIMMMGGFVIPKASVHPWVVWVYWIDPLQYAQRAIIINEFTASRWGALGPELLSIRSFPNHYWYACLCLAMHDNHRLHAEDAIIDTQVRAVLAAVCQCASHVVVHVTLGLGYPQRKLTCWHYCRLQCIVL